MMLMVKFECQILPNRCHGVDMCQRHHAMNFYYLKRDKKDEWKWRKDEGEVRSDDRRLAFGQTGSHDCDGNLPANKPKLLTCIYLHVLWRYMLTEYAPFHLKALNSKASEEYTISIRSAINWQQTSLLESHQVSTNEVEGEGHDWLYGGTYVTNGRRPAHSVAASEAGELRIVELPNITYGLRVYIREY